MNPVVCYSYFVMAIEELMNRILMKKVPFVLDIWPILDTSNIHTISIFIVTEENANCVQRKK